MVEPPAAGGNSREGTTDERNNSAANGRRREGRQRARVLFGLREKAISQERLQSRFIPHASNRPAGSPPIPLLQNKPEDGAIAPDRAVSIRG